MTKQSTVEILDVTTGADAKKHLRGFHLDRPRSGERIDSSSVTVVGWVVARESRAVAVEVVADNEVVGQAPVEIVRASVAGGYEDVPGADAAGFRITIEGDGKGEADLVIRAVLERETRVPFARIRARIARRRLHFLRRRRPKP